MPKTLKPLFVDTNILIYCTLLTKEGHDSVLIERLTQVLRHDKAELLLPEIVELEYQRKINEVFEQVRKSIGKLTEAIEKIDFPVYLADDKKAIKEFLLKLLAEREENKINVTKALDDLFISKNVRKIPLTPEINLNAYRRAARGLKPFDPKEVFQGISADCLIVESIRELLETHKIEKLLFCSNNTKDFSLSDKDGRQVLHPDISATFSTPVSFFSSLVELLQVEFRLELSEIDTKLYQDAEVRYQGLSMSSLLEPISWSLNPQLLKTLGEQQLANYPGLLQTMLGPITSYPIQPMAHPEPENAPPKSLPPKKDDI
jgi:hypothetical protein